MAHDDRRLNYEDRVERQLHEFLKSLPFEDGRAKYDKFLGALSPDSDETNWLLHHEEFIDWVSNSSGGIFCLYGKRE